VNDTYTRLRATALRLVTEFGRPIQISESTLALSDPTKPWGSTGDVTSTTTYTAYGAFMQEDAGDLSARLSAVSRLVVSPVETTDVQVTVAAEGLGVVPTTAMQVIDGDRTMEIKKVVSVQPGSVVIMYILTLEN
jgi:hypothetical protein